MTRAVIGSNLNLYLTPQEAGHLAKEFCLWKGGLVGPGDYFGKDSAFMRPKGVVDAGIRKVHLETPGVTPAWNRLLGQGVKNPDRFTSDKILVYVHLGDVKNTPYLLLAILEPGHAQMSDPDLVAGLGVLYEKERSALARTFPGDEWVTAGFN